MKHSTLKPAGFFETTGLYGELKRGETLQCVHCQFSWIVEPGSGRQRGYCSACAGYHCGAPSCRECVPIERRLENLEAGRAELTPAPVSVWVPAGIETIS